MNQVSVSEMASQVGYCSPAFGVYVGVDEISIGEPLVPQMAKEASLELDCRQGLIKPTKDLHITLVRKYDLERTLDGAKIPGRKVVEAQNSIEYRMSSHLRFPLNGVTLGLVEPSSEKKCIIATPSRQCEAWGTLATARSIALAGIRSVGKFNKKPAPANFHITLATLFGDARKRGDEVLGSYKKHWLDLGFAVNGEVWFGPDLRG
jgi:hypothetical protein